MLRSGRDQRKGMRARLQGRAFSAMYGPLARIYEPFTAWLFLGEWDRWRQAVLPLLPVEGVVLELGAGTGRLARTGSSPRRRWIAIEPSASMLAVVRRHQNQDVVWHVRAKAESLPFANHSVDAVVATFPAPYIAAQVTAQEIRRVLAPAGRVVVVVSGTLAPHGPRRRIRRAALALFYGFGASGADWSFSLSGFEGATRTVASLHGRAAVYVGRPAQAADQSLRRL